MKTTPYAMNSKNERITTRTDLNNSLKIIKNMTEISN